MPVLVMSAPMAAPDSTDLTKSSVSAGRLGRMHPGYRHRGINHKSLGQGRPSLMASSTSKSESFALPCVRRRMSS